MDVNPILDTESTKRPLILQALAEEKAAGYN